MRSLVKKLHVADQGTQVANNVAIDIAIENYVTKMQSKGWNLFFISAGNNFSKYTAYVHLYK